VDPVRDGPLRRMRDMATESRIVAGGRQRNAVEKQWECFNSGLPGYRDDRLPPGKQEGN